MQKFDSKIDAWLVLVVIAAIGLTLFQSIALSGVSLAASAISLAAALFIIALCFAVAVPCRYALEADHLFIQSGLMKRRIAYRDIKKIEPSSLSLSAPALSLRRVKISYGKTFQLVSPRERELFIKLLQERVAAVQAKA